MRVFLVLCLAVELVHPLSFSLPQGKKCIKDMVIEDVLVVGEYELSESQSMRTNVLVEDSNGHILFQREDATDGKFAFTTENSDLFSVCFTSFAVDTNLIDSDGDMLTREVTLTLKHGPEAKDFDSIASVEKFKPSETLMYRMEQLAFALVQSFSYLSEREKTMRDTNTSTLQRVSYFSSFSVVSLLVLATLQICLLRKFFKAKKLIS